MAFEESSVNISRIAGENLTIFRFVNVQSDETIDMTDAPADIILGINQETVDSGVVAPVAISGVAMIELGATLAAGVMVSSGTDGVAAAASTTTDEIIVGPLLQGGVSGDIVAININIRSVDAIV